MRGRVLWSFDDALQSSLTSSTGSLGAEFGLGLGISSARTSFSSELSYGAVGLDGLAVFAAKLNFAHAF